MNDFLTWEVLGTFAGCVAAVVILTELLKKILPKITPLLISFVVALVILTVSKVVSGTMNWTDFVLNLINAAAVSLSANGGFDILKKAFGKKVEMDGTLEVDIGDPDFSSGTGMYLTTNSDPKFYEDGQEVKLKVHIVDSQE